MPFPHSRLWRAAPEQRAYEEARHRVRALRFFYLHAMVYVVVNAMLIGFHLMGSSHRPWAGGPLMGWGIGLAVHGIMTWGRVGLLGRRWEERKIAEYMAQEQVRTLSTEKQLVEARMKLLQAQIEPHFLFNTLANVVSLIEPAPQKATMMLEHFIAYLRASLAASRATQGTVAQEAKLLRDYLALIRIRMGERLHYTVDVDAELETVPLAPMLLQPVVENAIKHGLEPKIEGGRLLVRLERRGARMLAMIEDDGMGFRPSAGAGVGLSNLRERLGVLYDGDAHVRIEERSPGTAVLIDLPLPPASRTGDAR
ncbi:Histidine kinase [Cupriavidus neocaledonicus]|uniref:Histidine kinase n=1 Tax=Cupriavidus neocaledonicus TaxID=1040979 RepID=A0A375H8C6_9BURK|nr:putative signal transduction histidine kinase, LytS C_term similar [Cupriavidus neocaledonicus]SPD48251.1 Histidine kinase [Cupriavidus neocaledonicus]